MPNPTRDPTLLLQDSILVSFLKLRGHNLVPVICRDDPVDPRVAWDPTNCDQSKLEFDMLDFYNDARVGIQSFNTVFKAVKSSMYNLKRINIQNI